MPFGTLRIAKPLAPIRLAPQRMLKKSAFISLCIFIGAVILANSITYSEIIEKNWILFMALGVFNFACTIIYAVEIKFARWGIGILAISGVTVILPQLLYTYLLPLVFVYVLLCLWLFLKAANK